MNGAVSKTVVRSCRTEGSNPSPSVGGPDENGDVAGRSQRRRLDCQVWPETTEVNRRHSASLNRSFRSHAGPTAGPSGSLPLAALALESGTASGGKLRFDAFKAFGDVAERAPLGVAACPQAAAREGLRRAARSRSAPTRTPCSGRGPTSPSPASTRTSNSGCGPRRADATTIARYVRELTAEGVLARA